MILVNFSDHNVKVHAIYRLSRGGEEERVQELNLENRMLLWHGSRVPNFISILSRGLLISPSEAQITGHMFGEVTLPSFFIALLSLWLIIENPGSQYIIEDNQCRA